MRLTCHAYWDEKWETLSFNFVIIFNRMWVYHFNETVPEYCVINVVIWTSVLNEYNKFVSCKAASTNILRSSFLVLLFLSLKFKDWRLTAIFCIWGFESKFYLETWQIVLVISSSCTKMHGYFLLFYPFVLEKREKTELPITNLLRVTMS
jgi:hypothetical protein